MILCTTMHSRWISLKAEAVAMRKRGRSIKEIEMKLGIRRSTLSGWFRNVSLTKKQSSALQRRWEKGLVSARIEAVKWHNAQKAIRLQEAARAGEETLKRITYDSQTLELALAMLYLGEGSKTNDQTSLGSSDPRIARFFINAIHRLYGTPLRDIRCYLHLRADQNPQKLVRYWSRELGLSARNFGKSLMDKRTVKSPTYPRYKGVCAISCGRVAIQRRLMYIANGYCEKLAAAQKKKRP